MKKIFQLFFLFSAICIPAQDRNALKIVSFTEVEQLQNTLPKPMIIFIYTDWCKSCHQMEKSTFGNEKVISLLNKSFYFIKLNGEEKKDIQFLRKTFVFKPSGSNTGMHQLAKELGRINHRLSYPTTTILDRDFKIVLQLKGLINKTNMSSILEATNKHY
jgi:thioredoxin-related protein